MLNRRTFLRCAPCAGAGLALGPMAAVPMTDPMLELIQAYRAGKDAFNEIPVHRLPTVADENRAVDETYGLSWKLFFGMARIRRKQRALLAFGRLYGWP